MAILCLYVKCDETHTTIIVKFTQPIQVSMQTKLKFCFDKLRHNKFILFLQVPKENPFVSIGGQEVNGQWNNCYYNNHPSTVWISFFV